MLKQILVINSTPTGLFENSFTGNMVIDAVFDERLARRLKRELADLDVPITVGEADDLDQPADRLFVVSDRVARLLDVHPSARVVIYRDMAGVMNAQISELAKRVRRYAVKAGVNSTT
ncbi:hypothetical protein [Lactiplantibacillus carotarum]|uniref:hypothetical protein n=1 Tax=Lactiplantibacillus carotarum TaxID=2993456 RepID=UPI00298F3CC3|nr:hypothetical protein [Lactiplantibacillus carotarum]